MPEPYPDLPLDIVGKILNAVVRELRAAAGPGEPLEEVFANGTAGPRIYACESIPVAIEEGTLTTNVPAMLVAPGAVQETRQGNQGYTELKVTAEIALLTTVAGATGTQDWLRARILRAVKRRLMREQGTLRDGDGLDSDPRLTDALQGFGRTEASGRIKVARSVLFTPFRATFTSYIDEATGEFLE
jgi:hypothetical protein